MKNGFGSTARTKSQPPQAPFFGFVLYLQLCFLSVKTSVRCELFFNQSDFNPQHQSPLWNCASQWKKADERSVTLYPELNSLCSKVHLFAGSSNSGGELCNRNECLNNTDEALGLKRRPVSLFWVSLGIFELKTFFFLCWSQLDFVQLQPKIHPQADRC